MDKTTVINIICDFRTSLQKKNIKVEKIILYGSYASNQAHFGSDIDLIVISESFKNMDLFKRMEILTDAIYEVHAPIEAVGFTPKEWKNKQSMIKGFAKEGQIIHPYQQ